MTNQKPCLPECYWVRGEKPPIVQWTHAPDCPNAEAPKVATNSNGMVTSGYIVPAKPAPAPEPKQGSEPVTELEAEKSTSKILRARLAEVEAENKELQKCSCEAPFENDCPACLLPSRMNLKAEREALRAEVLDLKRKLEVLESDRGTGCNPSRDPDHNDR